MDLFLLIHWLTGPQVVRAEDWLRPSPGLTTTASCWPWGWWCTL